MDRNEAARKKIEDKVTYRKSRARSNYKDEQKRLDFLDLLPGSKQDKKIRRDEEVPKMRDYRRGQQPVPANDKGEFTVGTLRPGEARAYSRAKMAALKKKIAQRKKDK
jgi:hypothetical protein